MCNISHKGTTQDKEGGILMFCIDKSKQSMYIVDNGNKRTRRFRMSERPDVIEILKKERDYHVEQIKKIDVAISALNGSSVGGEAPPIRKIKRRVRWKPAIAKLLSSGNFNEFVIEDVQRALFEVGFEKATTSRGRNSINTVLSRLEIDGVLVRTGVGSYRKFDSS